MKTDYLNRSVIILGGLLLLLSCQVPTTQTGNKSSVLYTGMVARKEGSARSILYGNEASKLINLTAGDCYAKRNETIKLTISFKNQNDYLVLSFYLNDIQYSALYAATSARYFAYDPELDQIVIHLTMDNSVGEKIYKISNIKYIDGVSISSSGSQHDVEINAKDTVNIGVQSQFSVVKNNSETIEDVFLMPNDPIPNISIPSRQGYSFVAWYSDIALTSIATIPSFMTENDFSIYAGWTANKNTLSFNPNGGTGNMPDQVIATNSIAVLNANTFIKEGFSFSGWSTSTTGQIVLNDGASYTMGSASSETIYAQWNAITNTISFNSNGGNGTMADQSIRYGETSILSENRFTKNGCIFKGWTEEPDGSLLYLDLASYTMGLNSISLYAKWSFYNEDYASYVFEYIPISDSYKVSGLTAYGATKTSITIPSVFFDNGKKVTEIGENFSANRPNLDFNKDPLISVIVSDGISRIGLYAFHHARNLANLSIPSSVISVGEYAAGSSNKIVTVDIPIKPDGWDNNWNAYNQEVVWVGCTEDYATFNFEYVSASDSYKVTGLTAYGARKTEITIPAIYISNGKKVLEIASYFSANGKRQDNNPLRKISISDGIQVIGDYAFHHTSGNGSSVDPFKIYIPKSIVTIGEYACGVSDGRTLYVNLPNKPASWNVNWNPYNCAIIWNFSF